MGGIGPISNHFPLHLNENEGCFLLRILIRSLLSVK